MADEYLEMKKKEEFIYTLKEKNERGEMKMEKEKYL